MLGGMEKPFIPFSHVSIPTVARPGEWYECRPVDGSWYHVWDITKANALMIARVHGHGGDTSRLRRSVLTDGNRQAVLESGVEIDEAHLWSPACDPRRPILAVAIDGREYIIDGWHRARRAVLMGWAELPCFVLTDVEDHFCRICRCCAEKRRIAAWARGAAAAAVADYDRRHGGRA